jgi:hypothetical protein
MILQALVLLSLRLTAQFWNPEYNLEVRGLDWQDAFMCQRFFDREGIKSVVLTSTLCRLLIAEKHQDTAHALRLLQREYGIEIIRKGMEATASQNSQPFSMVPDTALDPQVFVKYFAASSLVAQVIRNLPRNSFRPGDKIVSFSYNIRPYLSKQFKCTQVVDGTLDVVRNGTDFTTPVFWVPGEK